MDDENQKQIIIGIHTAIKQGDAGKVVSLIGSDKARLNMMTPFGTWLYDAAVYGKLEIVKRLVSLGADVNASGFDSGSAPLHIAAAEGHLDIVRYLLSCGAQMDVSEPVRNPLFAAIHGGHAAVAKLLIGSGIDTRVKYSGECMKNTDAMAFAHQWGRRDIEQLLQHPELCKTDDASTESSPAPDSSMAVGNGESEAISNKTTERALSEMDRQMLSEARTAAREMLKLPEDALPQQIQERIHKFLEGLFTRKGLFSKVEVNTLGGDAPMAMGALWGDAICTEFGWEWITAIHGDWEGIGISDSQRQFLALPMNYFEALIKVHPGKANLPSIQLYNSIKAGNLPSSDPGSYMLIAHKDS